jgi:hypothetical protein
MPYVDMPNRGGGFDERSSTDMGLLQKMLEEH